MYIFRRCIYSMYFVFLATCLKRSVFCWASYSLRMKATDTTLWTFQPFTNINNRHAQRNIFLPNRYCRGCLRDNAEAAQSRRGLHKKVIVLRSMETELVSESPATCTKILIALRAMGTDLLIQSFFVTGLGPLASFGPTDMRTMK